MISVLPIWAPVKAKGVIVDTTSGSGCFRDLSPFDLGPIDTYVKGVKAQNFENLWQYSKVYPGFVDSSGDPLPEWYAWRDYGWAETRAHRYPIAKGRKPLYSYWGGGKLSYIEARKTIYAPLYAKYVARTDAYGTLQELAKEDLILLDYDAYDHRALKMSLKDVINNPNRKMGHAFVLMMMLTGELEECLK